MARRTGHPPRRERAPWPDELAHLPAMIETAVEHTEPLNDSRAQLLERVEADPTAVTPVFMALMTGAVRRISESRTHYLGAQDFDRVFTRSCQLGLIPTDSADDLDRLIGYLGRMISHLPVRRGDPVLALVTDQPRRAVSLAYALARTVRGRDV